MESSFADTVNQTPGHDNGILRTASHMNSHVVWLHADAPARSRAEPMQPRPRKISPEARRSVGKDKLFYAASRKRKRQISRVPREYRPPHLP